MEAAIRGAKDVAVPVTFSILTNVVAFAPLAFVPGIMGKAARFLFLPKWKEAFGRTVAEAVLSGCELVCNDNIGALSYGWDGRREWAEMLAKAPADFWRIVTEVLQ